MQDHFILDDEAPESLSPHSDTAFHCLFYSLVLFPISFTLFMSNKFPSHVLNKIPDVITYLIITINFLAIIFYLYFNIIGIWLGIQSILKQEVNRTKKYVGLFGNIILLTSWIIVFWDVLFDTGWSFGLAIWILN